MSIALVRKFVRNRGLERYVARARRIDLNLWGGSEDVAVGFAMSRLRPAASLTYVSLPLRRAPNLGCFKNDGMYSNPRNDSVVIHYVKKPQGMVYLWGVLHDGRQHEPRICRRTAGVS